MDPTGDDSVTWTAPENDARSLPELRTDIISIKIRSTPLAVSNSAISRKWASATRGEGTACSSRTSVPNITGTRCDIEPAMATRSTVPVRSRASRASSTARRLSSSKRDPRPAGSSMIRLVEKVLVVMIRAPARI